MVTLEAVTYPEPAFTNEYPVCVAEKLIWGSDETAQEGFTPMSLRTMSEPGFVLGGLGDWDGETYEMDADSEVAAKTDTGKAASSTKQSESTEAMNFFNRSMAGIRVSFSGVWPKVRMRDYTA